MKKANGEALEASGSLKSDIAAVVPRLDIFVANAASLGARKRMTDYPLEIWQHTFRVNVEANLVLLGALGIFHIKAHIAAVMGLITSLVVAIGIFGAMMIIIVSLNTFFFNAAEKSKEKKN